MQYFCKNCIHAWERNNDKFRCTEPKSPDHNKLVDGYNACDFYKQE